LHRLGFLALGNYNPFEYAVMLTTQYAVCAIMLLEFGKIIQIKVYQLE
jgi:hypothetical protein